MNTNENKYTGKVHKLGNTETVGRNATKKRELVLKTERQGRDRTFTNYAVFEILGDDCDKAGTLHEGDEVTVTFRLNGRLWEPQGRPSRWFLSAIATAIDLAGVNAAPIAGMPQTAKDTDDGEDQDDLPF